MSSLPSMISLRFRGRRHLLVNMSRFPVNNTVPKSSCLRFSKKYRVRTFCGSLFLRIDFFCVLWELVFAIGTGWFFLLGINFYDFQKVVFRWIDNIFSRFLLGTCNRNKDFKKSNVRV